VFVPLLSDLSIGAIHFANGEPGISTPYRKTVSCIFFFYDLLNSFT
jgi:hypothetical protein